MSNKQLTKSEEKKTLANPLTPEDVAQMSKNDLWADCDPKVIFKNFADFWNNYNELNTEERQKLKKEMDDKLGTLMVIMNLEKHYTTSEMVSQRFRPLLVEFCNQIVKEYNCQTSSEKALAQMASSAYVRNIEYSAKLNNIVRAQYISHEQNGYYALLAKEADRAFRQFITAMSTLKQFKSPQIEVNIKAKTAFIAGQQQVNDNRNATIETKESK